MRSAGRVARSGASRAALLFLIAACSASVPVTPTVSTTNTCKAVTDCSAYKQSGNLTCSNGACIAYADRKDLARFNRDPYATGSPLTLVISVPDTESFGFGSTIVVANTALALGGPGLDPCVGPLTTNTCVGLTGTLLESGDYETDPRTAEEVGRILNAGNPHTSLPSHATFRLLTSDATTLTTRASTGLPVMPVYGTVGNHFSSGLSVSPIGPGATLPITWLVNLQPGRYQREITVDPPFNNAFPPWRDVITIGDTQPPPDQLLLAAPTAGGTPIDPQANRTYVISSPAQDLTRWRAFLRESATGRLLSSLTTFDAALAKAALTGRVGTLPGVAIVLNTVTPLLPPIPPPTDQKGTELVLEPPADVVFPSLVYEATPNIPQQQTYPSVPAPALVQGVINYVEPTSGTATPVPSWIDFVSVKGAGELSPTAANVDLRYRTSVHTAADGSYSVRLPRGPYNVVVTPDPTTPYAVLFKTKSKEDNSFLVLDDTTGTSDGAVQSGRRFSVSTKPLLTGHVTLTDGRPLGGVEVEARPSFGNYDRSTVPTELDPIMPVERAATTVTDALGYYALQVDPGVYDILAKAPAASGFAWGVTIAHTVDPSSTIAPPVDVKVPAPIDASMRIYQTSTSTLSGALVRAYVAPGPNLPQIQIGEGMTDSDGVLTLFLSPDLPE